MAQRRPATQLDLEWLAPVRWEDLPLDVRDRLSALLADLLRQAARRDARGETGDDQ
jgi:hypothetical protein